MVNHINSKCSMAEHINQVAEQAPAAFRFGNAVFMFFIDFNLNLLGF